VLCLVSYVIALIGFDGVDIFRVVTATQNAVVEVVEVQERVFLGRVVLVGTSACSREGVEVIVVVVDEVRN